MITDIDRNQSCMLGDILAISELAFGVITKIVASLVASGTNLAVQEFVRRKRIEASVENACLSVVETLDDFFQSERIDSDHQALIITECEYRLSMITADYKQFFRSSLDPQKLFDDLHLTKPISEDIRNQNLDSFYEMVFVRMAALICAIPPTMKDWEFNTWNENFRRLDSISLDLKALFSRVNAIDGKLSRSGAPTVSGIRKYLTQKISVTMDITGLRSDQVMTGSLEDFFVHPSISEQLDESDKVIFPRIVDDTDASVECLGIGHNIIYGVAGSGKSTWASWFERSLLSNENGLIPLRVILRSVNYSAPPSLLSIVKAGVGTNLAERIDVDFVHRVVEDGRLCLVLDGYDEIGNQSRDAALEWIQELAAYASNVPIIITSRPLTTDHLASLRNNWCIWNIEPFDTQRIRKYIQKWYANAPVTVESENIEDILSLASRWSRDPTIEPLTGNPLLLTTLLTVHHLDGSLPTGRAELYERYVKGMLGVWDDRRKVNPGVLPLTLDQRRSVLTDLAVSMLMAGQDEISEEEALGVVESALTDMGEQCPANAVLDALRERSGLIVGPGTYNFSHKSIGEYLVANAIVNGVKVLQSGSRLDRFALFEHRDKDRWNTILFLWAGLAPLADVESFLNQCFDVSDYGVALGLFSDQFRRFPRVMRGTLATRSIEAIGLLRFDNGRVRLLAGGYNIKRPSSKTDYCVNVRLELPYAGIRSLQDRTTDVTTLIVDLLDDGFLQSHQLKGASLDARRLIWIRMVPRAKDEKTLRHLVRTMPFRSDKKHWMFWLLELAFSGHMLARTSDMIGLDARIRVLTDHDPEAIRVLMLAALSSLALRSFLNRAEDENIELDHRRTVITRISPAVLAQPKNISDDDLRGTASWSMLYERKPWIVGNDLLLTLKKMISISFDAEDELPLEVEELLQLLNDLVQRRDRLSGA